MQARRIGRCGTAIGAATAALLLVAAPTKGQDGQRTVLISALPLVEQTRVVAEMQERKIEAAELLAKARSHEEQGEGSKAAREAEERVRAVDLGWKACHLSRSPALTRTQREALRAQPSVDGEDGTG